MVTDNDHRYTQALVYFIFIVFIIGLGITQITLDSDMDINIFRTRIPFLWYLIVSFITIVAIVVYSGAEDNPNTLSFLIIPFGFISVTSTTLTLYLAYNANRDL
jgi:hypothetical protein